MKRKDKAASPLTHAQKKRRHEKFRQELKNGLLEGAMELGFYLLCFAIGIGFFALCGVESDDPELSMIVGMVLMIPIAILVVGVIHLFKKNRAPSQGTGAANSISRVYPNLQSLYDDLAGTVKGIRLEGFEIIIEYGGEHFSLKQKGNDIFFTLINGEALGSVLSGNDAYYLALEFAHENRRDGGPVVIKDTSIYYAQGGVIRYKDYFDRPHEVSLIECIDALNNGCIGKADTKEAVELFLNGYTLSVRFYGLYRGKKHHLSGWKWQRIRKLKEIISRGGYRLYESATTGKTGKYQ